MSSSDGNFVRLLEKLLLKLTINEDVLSALVYLVIMNW